MKRKIIIFTSITAGILAIIIVCMVLALLNYPPGTRPFAPYILVCTFLFSASISLYGGIQKIRTERRNGERTTWYKQTPITSGLMYLLMAVFYTMVVIVGRNLPGGPGDLFVYTSALISGVLMFLFFILTIINAQEDMRKAQIAKMRVKNKLEEAHGL